MYRDYLLFLNHILDACEFIERILPSSYDDFMQDEVLRFAVVKNLEIMGEATKHIPSDVKRAWREISWREMADMRNRLTHEYWGISYKIVWNTASGVVPQLREQIIAVIEREQLQREIHKPINN